MGKRKKANKKYKDTVFRMIFGNDRNELLKLYNAVNDSDYSNADDLTVNTLENAIYVGMKNDISFVFRDELALYEHQSTLNPNLPLRILFYVADLLQEMTKNMNIYGRIRLEIPSPHFIMFYNGEEDPGDIGEYRLSAMFTKQEENPQLELIVKIVNINKGQDNKVINGCRTLQEYAEFVAMVRYNRKTMNLNDAIREAVDDCIEKGILRDFFMKNKARVIKTSLYEYDAKRQRKFDREEGRIEGLREGRVKDRIIIIQRKIKRGKSLDVIADELETTIDEIEPLYNVVIKYSTDTDPEEILKEVIIKG